MCDAVCASAEANTHEVLADTKTQSSIESHPSAFESIMAKRVLALILSVLLGVFVSFGNQLAFTGCRPCGQALPRKPSVHRRATSLRSFERAQDPKLITSTIYNSNTARRALQIIAQEADNPKVDLICVSTALVRIAHAQNTINVKAWQRDPDVEKLVNLANRLLGWVLKGDPIEHEQAVGNTFWATAKLDRLLGSQLSTLRPRLFEAVKYTAYFLNPQSLANAIYGCALMRMPSETLDDLMTALCHPMVDIADRLDGQAVANILWSAAKLRSAAPTLLEQLPLLAEVAPDVMPSMGAQPVANSIWAISRLYQEAPELQDLLPSLARRATEMLPRMNPQDR